MQLADALLVLYSGHLAAENSGQLLQRLALPTRHLVRMHLVMRSNLRNRLLASDRLKGNLRLESR